MTDVQTNFKGPVKRKPKRGVVPIQVKRWVRERDGQRCIARVEGVCTGRAEHVHHILRRGQGGGNEMGNLISLCAACHGFIHDHVAWSVSHGYIRFRSSVKGSQ